MARPAVAAGPVARRPGTLLVVGTLAGCGALLPSWAVLVGLTGTFGFDKASHATTVLAFAAVGSTLAARLPEHPPGSSARPRC